MATRIVLLVRHGQVDVDSPESELGPTLTKLGRRQALATGRYLCKLPIRRFYSSPLNRAFETANLIVSRIPGIAIRETPLLQEVIPTSIPGGHVSNVRRHRRAADEAFDRFFAPPGRTDQIDCLVCHGNLIRYLMCRALGAPARAWLKLGVCYNCAITGLQINRHGTVYVCSYNTVDHLPPSLQTVF